MNQEKIKQVTKIKNPMRVAASKKSYHERMLKMKKEILENAAIPMILMILMTLVVVVPIILSQIMMYIFMV